MNTDYSPLPQNRSTRHQPKKDNAIIFCIRIAEQCTSYLSPDITGEFPNNDAEYDKYYAGAFWTGTPFEGGYSDQLPAGGKTGRFKASWANSIYGRTSSDVAVSAVYTLIIIKA